MNLITCTRILEFDAAHRVANHESKCATLHGHRYKAEITACGDLDSIGRVIDFSVLKEKIGSWIDLNWDHTTIVWKNDPLTLAALLSMPKKKNPFVCDFNPTAENMADYLLRIACPMLLQGTGVRVTKIRLWETPNCYAEAELV
jgi:6-pyruvoyltetrahydropterin/6-carboxytetrahydropterin synthase